MEISYGNQKEITCFGKSYEFSPRVSLDLLLFYLFLNLISDFYVLQTNILIL